MLAKSRQRVGPLPSRCFWRLCRLWIPVVFVVLGFLGRVCNIEKPTHTPTAGTSQLAVCFCTGDCVVGTTCASLLDNASFCFQQRRWTDLLASNLPLHLGEGSGGYDNIIRVVERGFIALPMLLFCSHEWHIARNAKLWNRQREEGIIHILDAQPAPRVAVGCPLQMLIQVRSLLNLPLVCLHQPTP